MTLDAAVELTVIVAISLLLAPQGAQAQHKRRPLDGATAFRISVGRGFPVGSEKLAKAWSAGPAIGLSVERYLGDPTTTREFSIGVLFRHSTHPFDAAGFVRDFRPGGDTPLTALGPTATVSALAAVGRVSNPRGRVSPSLSVSLGAFNTTRGDVTYTSSSGAKSVRIESKAGVEIGLGLGADIEFGANAIVFETGWTIGTTNKDDPEGTGVFSCNSGGCGVPRQRTQVATLRVGLRVGLRHAVARPVR